MSARVGIDFGGVIVRNRKRVPGEDTGLLSGEDRALAQDGVFETVREIVALCNGHVWIVSKAGPRIQARTRAWLNSVDFFSRTGLASDHVRFCVERQEKESICRELEITHFIDDRIHVMQILRQAVPHLYLFGAPGGERFCPPWATFVSTWAEVLGSLGRALESKHPDEE